MDLDVVDISRSPSASMVIYETLRKAIVSGKISPGMPLRQEDLAKSFNASRIPVREALAKLESQGLVESRRYKGAVVADLQLDEIAEIFDLRATVERDLMRRAIRAARPEKLDETKKYLEDFSASHCPEQWINLNRKFHCSLYEYADSPIYNETLNRLLDRLDRYLRAQLSLTNGVERADREHRALLEAFIEGDEEHASALTYDHVLGAKNSLLNYLESKRKKNYDR